MGNLTTDEQNPGRKQVKRFSVAAGLASNQGDQESNPVGFLLLKNCLVDKRLGLVLKKPGSLQETLVGTPGFPLGMSEYLKSSSGQTIPLTRTLVALFGGALQQQQAGTWSSIATSAYVNFSTSRQCTFAKLGGNMFIAAGLPAKWGGPTKTADRVGIIPPSSPATVNALINAGSITLIAGTRYVLTFSDSTTGLESDWSDPSISTGPVTAKRIDITIPAYTQTNWNQIKIYRYLDGGTLPYFVATVAAGTTSYSDNATDATLLQSIGTRYDRAVPPSSVYLTAKYAQCIWNVDDSNPYKICFSKPYTGSDVDLEYFPINNYIMANDPITGLFSAPGKLLLFHPRSISYISGYSVDDFVFQNFVPGVGTVFPLSIATNGADVVFLAEEGFVSMPLAGGQPRHISREIDTDLQPLLAGSYNSALYVSSAWNTSLRQFLFAIAAQSTAGSPWEEFGTGNTSSAVAGWQTTPGLIDDIWEDPANPNTSNSMKIHVWGWSAELSDAQHNLWMEYTFPSIADGNTSNAVPAFLFHPTPSSDTGDPQQDKTYMGIWTGTQGKIIACFRRDTNTDDGATITSELLTGRIVPGNQDGGYKFFHALGFQNAYSDPTSDSLATLKYLIDFDDPQIRSYVGSLITIPSQTADFKKLPTMQGKHIHLYISDTSQSQSKVLLGEFFVHFRERFRKESR